MQVDPWVKNIPRGGHGNPLQCSCLEKTMDRGAWRAIVHRVAKSWTRLKRLSMHAHVFIAALFTIVKTQKQSQCQLTD